MSFTLRSNSDRSSRSSRFSLSSLFYERITPRKTIRSSTSDADRGPSSSKVFTGRIDTLSKRSDSSSEDGTSSIQYSFRKSKNKNLLECPLCLQLLPKEKFPVLLTCSHRSCVDCLRQYLKIEVTESRTNIECPECAEHFHPNDIQAILGSSVLSQKYEEFMLRRVLVADPDVRWCPAPDCGYAVIAGGCASCPKISCERPGCGTSFCYHCKQQWHPNQTCDAARVERSSNSQSSPLIFTDHEHIHKDGLKPCPKCGTFIVKMDDGSCNHMTCAMCGAEFCWLCMQEISDLHYLSPSGCTFWGKKPWSRKKKVLWQLGMLAGAPIGISLVAGVAVPAIIIGLPVWVGRKLYNRHKWSSKRKRNAIIVGGVIGSVVVSPVMAALAVAVGVPILLAYVYGVVPISLCRSGGCGSNQDGDNIKVEFEEAHEITSAPSVHYEAEIVTLVSGRHNMNPSIGPSIGEMSLGNSLSISGSHIDRIGALWEEASDRKSSSQKAVAGESREGSVIDSSYQLAGGISHKLEVRADVVDSVPRRSSLCSDDISVDMRSLTISLVDNVSTRALAGSICTRESIQREMSATCNVDSLSTKPQLSFESPMSTPSVNFDESVGVSRKRATHHEGVSLYSWGDTCSVTSPSLSVDSGRALVDTKVAADCSAKGHLGDKVKCIASEAVEVNEHSRKEASRTLPISSQQQHMLRVGELGTAVVGAHGVVTSGISKPSANLDMPSKKRVGIRTGFPFRLTNNRSSRSQRNQTVQL